MYLFNCLMRFISTKASNAELFRHVSLDIMHNSIIYLTSFIHEFLSLRYDFHMFKLAIIKSNSHETTRIKCNLTLQKLYDNFLYKPYPMASLANKSSGFDIRTTTIDGNTIITCLERQGQR